MNKLIFFLKAISIGLANVVAGLSGGTVAVVTRLYEDLIDICTNIIKHPISTIKKHWMLLIGIIVGLLLGVLALDKLYDISPLPVSLFFCGIIIASIIKLKNDTLDKKTSLKNYLIMVLLIIIIISIPLITKGSDKSFSLKFSSLVILFVLGIISAASMIIPGVSGSMVLASFGYYKPVLDLVSDFIHCFINRNFSNFFELFLELLVFGIGCIVGIVLCAYLIKILIKKAKKTMDYAIFGLVCGSSVSMILVVLIDSNNKYLFNSRKGLLMWIIGIMMFFIGFFLGKFLNNFGKKEDNMNFSTEEFMERAKNLRDEWIKLTKDLVSFKSVLENFEPNSVAPFGEENKKALDFILNHAKNDGFKVYNCDNYAGHIEFGQGDETLGILAHLDVVPAVGNWSNDPFEATLTADNKKLIGRGVNDDKGPLAASYLALKMLKDMGFVPNKKVLLIMGCDEESGSRCLQHYFKYNKMPDLGFSPDACFPCINGEKAGVHYEVTGTYDDSKLVSLMAGQRFNIVPDTSEMVLNCNLEKEYLQFLKDNNYKGEIKDGKYYAYGLSAHAMCPQNGVNAAFIQFEFLDKYLPSELSNFVCKYLTNDPTGKKLGIDVYHDEMKELTENLGIVKISNKNVYLGVDCRVPVEGHEKLMQEALDKALKNTNLKANVNLGGHIHYVPSDSFLVKTLMDSYQSVTGDYTNKAFTIGGGTYAKFIDKAVAFGPQFVGREDVDHQTDEYVFVDDFVKTIAIYAKAIYELVK